MHPPPPSTDLQRILYLDTKKSPLYSPLRSKYTRTLNFENLYQIGDCKLNLKPKLNFENLY